MKNYTVPFAQLDPLKTILVFSHDHNTFDKKKLLENVNEQYFKPSYRTVSDFIRQPKEEPIKRFFMTDIDGLLSNYKPGEPAMIPDVLKQIKEIDEERKKMMASNQTLMVNEPGKEPRQITPDEIIGIVNRQTEHIKMLTDKNQELETMVANLQKKIADLNSPNPYRSVPPTSSEPVPTTSSTTSSGSFVDTLLTRIKDLETQLSSNTNTKRIEELELINKMLQQQLQSKQAMAPTVAPTGPSTIIKQKSKSTPEVKVVL